jgi:hypothetical protein
MEVKTNMIKKNIKITLHEFSMQLWGFIAACSLTFSNLLLPSISFANEFDDISPDGSPKAGQIRPKREFVSKPPVFKPPELTLREQFSLLGSGIAECIKGGVIGAPFLPIQSAAGVAIINGVSKFSINESKLRKSKDKDIIDATIAFNKGEASRSVTEDNLKKAGADPNLIKQSLDYGTCLNANPDFKNQMNKRNSQQLFAPSTLGPENTACYLDKRLFDKKNK